MRSSGSAWRMYTPFIHWSLSRSKIAAGFPTRSSVKLSRMMSAVMTSVSPSSDHPNSAMKLISASGRKPSSRYSMRDVAPCRLDSLARSEPRIIGRCPNVGISSPSARYSCTWRGVLGSHSSARSTWEISIARSSTTTAMWYVGNPSDLIKTKSSVRSFCHSTCPRMASSTDVTPDWGIAKRRTEGAPSASLAPRSVSDRYRQWLSYPCRCLFRACSLRSSATRSGGQ